MLPINMLCWLAQLHFGKSHNTRYVIILSPHQIDNILILHFKIIKTDCKKRLIVNLTLLYYIFNFFVHPFVNTKRVKSDQIVHIHIASKNRPEQGLCQGNCKCVRWTSWLDLFIIYRFPLILFVNGFGNEMLNVGFCRLLISYIGYIT